MKNYKVFFLFIICLSLSPNMSLGGSSSGRSTLDFFASLKPAQIACVGRIISAENMGFGTKDPRFNISATFQLEVEDILVGPEMKTITVVGSNTVYNVRGEWYFTGIAGASWVVPGDRVLIIGEKYPPSYNVEDFYHLKTVLYILDEEELSDNILYTYKNVQINQDYKKSKEPLPLAEILEGIERTPIQTKYKLSDINSVVGYAVKHERK